LKRKVLKIGITGGIGSGKSIICKVFKALQVPVYNADQRAKILVETSPEIRSQIRKAFGENSYVGSKYNRTYIAGKVFNNRILLDKLNTIIHPAVMKDFHEWTKQYNVPYLIEEAAILYESGANRALDHIIVVDAPEILRVSRIRKREGFSDDEIHERMQNQLPADKLRSLADWVIDNNDKVLVLPQILQLHHTLLEKSKV
jgi:dephospho-CoA kinase